jgi:hypothetical protein
MKKILSLVLVLFVVAQLYANNVDSKSPVGMSVLKSGTLVKLFYRGEQKGTVKVTIYNHRGVVIFRETMKDTEQFMRPYNFGSLPDGEYTIELDDQSGKRYQTLTYSTKKKQPIAAHVTRLNKDGNSYMLAVPNIGKETLTVRIYDALDKIIFQETQKVDGSFAKIYKLDGVSGDTTFEVVNRAGNIARLAKSSQ